jgi:hypothetical protein
MDQLLKNIKKFSLPGQKKVLYNWHQDEGTWAISNDKSILNKNPVTLWLSVNGSNINNSIHLIKNSHKNKVLNHSLIEGQGYFNANIKTLKPRYSVDIRYYEGSFLSKIKKKILTHF